MTIQEFGDAFKAQINNREAAMGLDGAVNAATFYTPGHHYAGGESHAIDDFFHPETTPDNGQFTAAELKKAGGAGTFEDWTTITDAEAGRILGQIFDLGIDDGDIIRHTTNDIAINYNGNLVIGSQAIIDILTFSKDFKEVAGASATATDAEINDYFGKNLTGAQAAALFNNTPQIAAADVNADGTVDFDGTNYDVKVAANIATLNNAKALANFRTAFKVVAAAAPNTDIDPYFDKGLDGAQAAALFNNTPQIAAADVNADGTVDFDGTNYDVKVAANIATLNNAKALANFRTAFKVVAAAAPNTDIDPYFDKGLDGAQAAALYNSTPRIAADTLKADKSGTVDFDGTNYDVKVAANIATLNNAKALANFRTAFKVVAAAAPNTDIDPYFDKGLDGAQAAALYNSTPRIAADTLKADKSGTVDFDGTNYDVKVAANIATLNNARVAFSTELRSELKTVLSTLETAFKDEVAIQWKNPSNKKINTKEEIKKLLETVIEEKNGVKKVKDDFITFITPRGATSLETFIASKEPKEVITAIKKYEYDKLLLAGEEMGQKDQEERQIRKALNKPTGNLSDGEVETTLYEFANGDKQRTTNKLDANLQEITTGGGDKSKSFMDYLAMGYYAPVWVSLLAIAGVIYKWESIKGWWNSSDDEDSEENNKEE